MRHVRLPRLLLWVAPLGLGAALLAHEVLRGIAAFAAGAPTFGQHEHTALGPAAFIETMLALWAVVAAVCDVLARRASPCYRRQAPVPAAALPFAAGGIALVAVLALFGMEFAECGRAALGLGWLGGSLLPGVPVLACAIAAAAGALRVVTAGRAAGFERLVALLAAAVAHLVLSCNSEMPAARPRHARLLTMRTAPCSRHAGLRAPPEAFA